MSFAQSAVKKFVAALSLVVATQAYAEVITTFPKSDPEKDSTGCYVIKTASELYGFASIVNGYDGHTAEREACGYLANDIVVNENVLDEEGDINKEKEESFAIWTPFEYFSGTFDGRMHTVSGLYFSMDTVNALGFFASVVGSKEKPAVIKNFGLEDSYFRAKIGALGMIVAKVLGAESEETASYVKIQNVYSTSTFSSINRSFGIAMFVGGAGDYSNIEMENCYNHGRAIGTGLRANGLIGFYEKEARVKVTNCYSVWKTMSGMDSRSKALFETYASYYYTVSNCYYLDTQGYQESGGKAATESAFKNGTVAQALRDGENGSVWGQNVGVDDAPNFSGKIENSLVERYNVIFHTYEGDSATYFDNYIAGLNTQLPSDVYILNGEFLGWYANPEFTGKRYYNIDSTQKGDLEFWARFQGTFEVTFHTNGGEIIDEIDSYYTKGVGIKLPRKVRRDSCLFLGWYDNKELKGKRVTEITAADVGEKNYYASWLKLRELTRDPSDRCFIISDVIDLYSFASMVNYELYAYHAFDHGFRPAACAKLTQDIVVNKNVLKEDGTLDSANVGSFLPWVPMYRYYGNIYGQGHKISGLYGDSTSATFGMGLISLVPEGMSGTTEPFEMHIKDLTIEDSYFGTETGPVGGFIGMMYGRMGVYDFGNVIKPGAFVYMENCHFKGTLKSSIAGGLIGKSLGTLYMTDSHNEGVVDARNAGGLIGIQAGNANISDSYNFARIIHRGGASGGLVGNQSDTLNITRSANLADVVNETPETYGTAGGLVGESQGLLKITESYNVGNVGGYISYMGGIVAMVYKDALIANSYNTGKVYNSGTKGMPVIGGIVGRIDGKAKSVKMLNNFNLAYLSGGEYVLYSNQINKNAVCENNFAAKIPASSRVGTYYGVLFDLESFTDNTVATALHDYVQKDSLGNEVENGITGLVWTQGENHPILLTNKHIERSSSSVTPGSSSSAAESSSSSEIASSSSSSDVPVSSSSEAKSSSSEAVSSSSNAPVSSSAAPLSSSSSSVEVAFSSSSETGLSSSSSAPASSSSSSVPESSSSSDDEHTAFTTIATAPHYSVNVNGHEITVAGAPVGATVSVFDIQGQVLFTRRSESANFSLKMPQSGTYLLRIGKTVQRVQLR